MSRFKLKLATPVLLICTILCSCKTEIPLIKPPFPEVSSHWYTAEFDCTEGHEVSFDNGSRLSIPPNAFVNKDGQQVSGSVQFRFREISDVNEILVSGIQMFVSSKGPDVMVSADMFELRAYQDNEALHLAEGKSIRTELASNTGGNDYDLYYLDEQQKGWNNLTAVEPTENPTRNAIGDSIVETNSRIENLDMTNTFALNYLPLIDLKNKPIPRDKTFHYHNYENDPSYAVIEKLVLAKLKQYGTQWIFGYDNKYVKHEGKVYHASMVLWQSEKPIPSWIVNKRNEWGRHFSLRAEVLKLKSGKYKISITEWRRTSTKWSYVPIFSTIATVKIPLKELYSKTPTVWNEEIEQLLQEAEDLKAQYETQNLFLRTFEVTSMGIYNYDRIKKEEQILVNVDLQLDGKPLEWSSDIDLYTIPRGDNTVIRYHSSQKDRFVVYPGQDMIVMMVINGKQVALIEKDFFDNLDYDQLKKEPSQGLTLKLQTYPEPIASMEDVQKILQYPANVGVPVAMTQ